MAQNRTAPTIRLTRHDGHEVEIGKGARLTWANPCGIGGATIAATLAGIDRTPPLFGEPPIVCLDVEPCAELRAIWEKVAKEGGPFFGDGDPCAAALRGKGGKMIVTGEAFYRAFYEGALALAPPEPAE